MPFSPTSSPRPAHVFPETSTPSPKTITADATNAHPNAAGPAVRPSGLMSPLLLPAKLSEAARPTDNRRPSVQFLSQKGPPRDARSGSRGPKARPQRRFSSPPPPPAFENRVSFDTFSKPADFIEDTSFTLSRKHKEFVHTKRSRTFLCGLDTNDYSEYALTWLIDELVDDGDEIVCLRVVDPDSKLANEGSMERGRYRQEAETMMEKILLRNTEQKAINLVLEFSVGKVQKVIEEMINLYEPAMLVVGTRGRSLGGFQGLMPGSVSKYCLQHSPVPVIVVRPNAQRVKTKRKRMQDPSRGGYRDLLDKSGHVLDRSNRNSFVMDSIPPIASAEEAAAVAKAVGYNPPASLAEDSPLSDAVAAEIGAHRPSTPDSPNTDYNGGNTGNTSPDLLRSPGVVMKSPELQNLDSPDISSESSDEDEEDGGVRTTGMSASAPAHPLRESITMAESDVVLPSQQENATPEPTTTSNANAETANANSADKETAALEKLQLGDESKRSEPVESLSEGTNGQD